MNMEQVHEEKERSLKSIGSQLFNRFKKKPEAEVEQKSEDKAKHERAYWVEKTRKALGVNLQGKEYSFGQVNGMTRHWTKYKIRDRFLHCEKHSNFPKVWFGMRKKELES